MDSCNENIVVSPLWDFIGCDGKPWSDDFLNFHLDMAITKENYEWANKCKI
jgi:hypothetical protein